jgi:anti-anti-sigma regulatory factor
VNLDRDMPPPSQVLLSLQGDLTTPQAEATRDQIMNALSEHSAVALDCSGAADMDVTFVQILVAAARAAAMSSKVIRLSSPPSGLLISTLHRCGFSPSDAATASLSEFLSI